MLSGDLQSSLQKICEEHTHTLGLVHIFLAKHRHRDSVKKYLTCKIENKIVFRLHFSSYCIQKKKKKNCLLVLIMADVNPCVATYIFVSL